MRFLAPSLVVAIATVTSNCYSPGFDDCQFKCGTGDACPVGMRCVNGFCRETSASGVCSSGPIIDSSGGDGSGDPCPGAPQPPSGCGAKFGLLGGGCGVVCETNKSQQDAKSACSNAGWRLAILDSAAKLDQVPTTTGSYWVGASRMTTTWQWDTGATVAGECWAPSNPATNTITCASMIGSSRRLTNTTVQCTSTQPFICTR